MNEPTDALAFVESIHAADRTVIDPVRMALPKIAEAAIAIADRMRDGGRLFYAGAGTSGRLAVLDAAELLPTFGVGGDRVIALIAGGDRAFTEAIEGAEDDPNAAAERLAKHGFAASDALLSLAASGTTPYALGALREGLRIGALTIGFSCTANSPLAREAKIGITVVTGDEVLKGSTRMKAGTAQKLVLQALSTTVMQQLGLIHRGEMVAMKPTNAKLRERAVRIVRDLTGAIDTDARRTLECVGFDLPVALVCARHRLDPEAARSHLLRHRGSVDAALRIAP